MNPDTLYLAFFMFRKIHNVWVRALLGKIEIVSLYFWSLLQPFSFPALPKNKKRNNNLHVFEVIEQKRKNIQ